MAKLVINNGDTGLTVRNAINDNFTELYDEAPVPGPPGPQGPQGIQGETGIQGIQGLQGLTGPQGETGAQGIQGIPGVKGDTGDTGPQGLQGIQGIPGDTGPQGLQGLQGVQGDDGPQGIQGPAGVDGNSIVLKGAVATVQDLPPSGNVEGDMYVVTASGDGYVWDGLTWQNVGPIRGPQGIQGATGATGSQGIQGEIGPQGIQGEIGPQGIQGIQGIQGEIGPQGIQGIQGEIGPEGPEGPQGIQGIPGVSGGGNVYATVALMVAAGTLVAGDTARTLGYYAANDGGGSYYQITSSADTVDGGSVISVGGGLQAKLIVTNNTIAIAQFGAKNDGTTDNVIFIQNALNYMTTIKGTIYFKPGTYLVSDRILMKSYVTLLGYGAIIYRNSNAVEVTMFYSTTTYLLYDIAFVGITLQSTQDRVGAGDYAGATVSNIMAIYFEGVIGMIVKDVKMYGVNMGIKLGKGQVGNEYNHNIRIDNFYCQSLVPLTTIWTYDLKMSNSTLDATSTGGTLLHCFYVKNGSRDFIIEGCDFIGAPGAGLHCYNTVTGDPQPTNIQFSNCKYINCITALYIWSKATHFQFDNIIMKGCSNSIYINDSYYMTFSNIHIDDIAVTSGYVLRLTSSSDATFNNIIVDGTNLSGAFIYPSGTNTNLRILNCKLLNFVGSNYYIVNGAVAFINFEIRGCIFHLTALDRSRLRIEAGTSTGVIVDNRFYVDSTSFTEIIDIYAGALVLVANNAYKGPTNLCKTTDVAKCTRNINMTTWVTDPTRNIT